MKINVDLGEKEEYWEREGKLPEDIEIDKQDGEELRKAVNSLEIKYREVIWLYYFEDKNYDEISDILRIPISNVGVLLFRAKEKLKRRYEKK